PLSSIIDSFKKFHLVFVCSINSPQMNLLYTKYAISSNQKRCQYYFVLFLWSSSVVYASSFFGINPFSLSIFSIFCFFVLNTRNSFCRQYTLTIVATAVMTHLFKTEKSIKSIKYYCQTKNK